jgi:hypothetical protein
MSENKKICGLCREGRAVVPVLPKGEEKFCSGCWEERSSKVFGECSKFRIKRILRTEAAEEYFIFHPDGMPGAGYCGKLFAFKFSDRIQLTAVLLPSVKWARPLPFDPRWAQAAGEIDTFLDALINVIVGDVVETWGGGDWLLEVIHAADNDFADYSGEI